MKNKYQPTGALLSGSGRRFAEVTGFARSVDGQDLPPAGATAGTAQVAGSACRRLNHDIEASRSTDHGGGNCSCELGTTSYGGGQGGAIEDHHGGGNEMSAAGNDDEAGRQL